MIDDHLRAALEHSGGLMNEAALEAWIKLETSHVIKLPNSTICAEIVTHPNVGIKTIDFPYAGGNLEEIKAYEPRLLEWGRKEGCTKAILSGRRGWARALGYTPAYTVMTKDL